MNELRARPVQHALPALWLGFLIASGACHHKAPVNAADDRPQGDAKEICTGSRSVRVQNSLNDAVDAYWYKNSENVQHVLGTARPGLTEFGLPPLELTDRVWLSFRRNGSTVAPAFGNRRAAQSVTYKVLCHTD
ncbi:MAG: hypothetical protein ABJB66_12020 [Gemmatimonadaceae bacterium]